MGETKDCGSNEDPWANEMQTPDTRVSVTFGLYAGVHRRSMGWMRWQRSTPPTGDIPIPIPIPSLFPSLSPSLSSTTQHYRQKRGENDMHACMHAQSDPFLLYPSTLLWTMVSVECGSAHSSPHHPNSCLICGGRGNGRVESISFWSKHVYQHTLPPSLSPSLDLVS
jgi:hypothetical protein